MPSGHWLRAGAYPRLPPLGLYVREQGRATARGGGACQPHWEIVVRPPPVHRLLLLDTHGDGRAHLWLSCSCSRKDAKDANLTKQPWPCLSHSADNSSGSLEESPLRVFLLPCHLIGLSCAPHLRRWLNGQFCTCQYDCVIIFMKGVVISTCCSWHAVCFPGNRDCLVTTTAL
jgi:hypothetical protein